MCSGWPYRGKGRQLQFRCVDPETETSQLRAFQWHVLMTVPMWRGPDCNGCASFALHLLSHCTLCTVPACRAGNKPDVMLQQSKLASKSGGAASPEPHSLMTTTASEASSRAIHKSSILSPQDSQDIPAHRHCNHGVESLVDLSPMPFIGPRCRRVDARGGA